jgi:hypothetical protein
MAPDRPQRGHNQSLLEWTIQPAYTASTPVVLATRVQANQSQRRASREAHCSAPNQKRKSALNAIGLSPMYRAARVKLHLALSYLDQTGSGYILPSMHTRVVWHGIPIIDPNKALVRYLVAVRRMAVTLTASLQVRSRGTSLERFPDLQLLRTRIVRLLLRDRGVPQRFSNQLKNPLDLVFARPRYKLPISSHFQSSHTNTKASVRRPRPLSLRRSFNTRADQVLQLPRLVTPQCHAASLCQDSPP